MARMPAAVWRGPIVNQRPGALTRPVLGLVMHIQQGTERGTDAWFHNPLAQVSAHFGNPKAGPLDQWVDTDSMAWAESAGNSRWISLENEGYSGETLTPSQHENAAQLLVWLHHTEAIALRVSIDPLGGEGGLTDHAAGGNLWGGHPSCPGAPIIAQLPSIVARANAILGMPAPSVRLLELTTPYMTGADVRAAQRKLRAFGAHLVDDGVFGPMTRSAVIAFQASHGLAADGVIGPHTRAKLGL